MQTYDDGDRLYIFLSRARQRLRIGSVNTRNTELKADEATEAMVSRHSDRYLLEKHHSFYTRSSIHDSGFHCIDDLMK